jgi:hypothetical protein
MSPTSYRLLYSAMWIAKVRTFFGNPKFFCGKEILSLRSE